MGSSIVKVVPSLDFTLYTDLPTMAFDNPVRGSKSQAGTFPDIFGGEKGIEDAGQVLFSNTLTGVSKLHEDLFPMRCHGRW